jgi:integrase
MNRKQSACIVAGFLLVVALFLFPPWKYGRSPSSYGFLFARQAYGTLDVTRLLVEWLLVLRELEGNPQSGPILRGPLGKPLNLDNLAKRTVRPILAAKGLRWHGWYALRRGIATLLNSVEKDNAMAAKGLLRHTSVATTQKHYIKDVPEVTLQAMEKIEALCTNRANSPESRPN